MLTAERRSQLSLLPPPFPGQTGEGITLREIFAMLRRRMPLIAAAAVIGAGLATLVGHQVERQYTATAAVVIDPLDGQVLQIPGAADAKATVSPEVLETQIALITSRTHLEAVMRDLGLLEPQPWPAPSADDVPGIVPGLPEPLRQLAAYVPETWLVAAGLANDAPPPPAAETVPEPGLVRQAAVDHFRRDLDVRRASNAYVITISYTDPDPGVAAEIANAVAESYVATQLEQRRTAAGRAAGWLQERLETLREAVARSEQAVAEYRAVHGLYGPAGRTFNEQKLLEVNRQLIALRAEQVGMEAKLRRTRESRGANGSVDALAESLGSTFISNLRGHEAGLLRQLAELGQTYGERHPSMLNLRAQIEEVRAKIRLEIDRAIRNLDDELAVLADRERTLVADLAAIEREQETVQQDELRLRELERQAEASRQHYEALLRRFKTSQEQESVLLPDARIISPAVAPERPSTPGPRVFGMIGFTVSSMLGGFLALVLERLNRRVRSAAALEQALGFPVLGLMPRLPTRKARRDVVRYMVEKPMSAFTESGRSILMGLRLGQQDAACSALLVTSALPEEGKSTLSLALAAAAADSGFKVLLVDLDLRRPALSRLAPSGRLTGSASGASLVELLHGELPFQQLVQHDPDTRIDFILAGRPPRHPLTVLQSPELRYLIETVRRAYDFVILDSAPLLAVAEAQTAARLADRVILATRWRRTDTEAVGHAVRLLMQIQADLAGCVLTDVSMSKYKLYATDAGSYYGQYRSYYAN